MRIIITATILFFLTLQAFGQNYKYVNVETLNVRENAGKKYNVVGQINKGDKITELSESGSWTEIETEKGIKGYVATKYLSLNNDTQTNSDDIATWISVLLALGFIGLAVYKIYNLFAGLFRGSVKQNKKSYSGSIFKPTVQKTKFICKDCGYENESLNRLLGNQCYISPTRKHRSFEGGVKAIYLCKDCGYENKSLNRLLGNQCYNSPTRKHRPHY